MQKRRVLQKIPIRISERLSLSRPPPSIPPTNRPQMPIMIRQIPTTHRIIRRETLQLRLTPLRIRLTRTLSAGSRTPTGHHASKRFVLLLQKPNKRSTKKIGQNGHFRNNKKSDIPDRPDICTRKTGWRGLGETEKSDI
jgi:hypothetical protein